MGAGANFMAVAGVAHGRSAIPPPCIAPLLHTTGPLHQALLDLLPQPIFVRSAAGVVLYANRALNDACGMPPGSLPQPWQIAPQFTTVMHTQRMGNSGHGSRGGSHPASRENSVHGGSAASDTANHEMDLPLDIVSPGVGKAPLPPASQSCTVLLHSLDTSKPPVLLSSLHRIPFWLSADDGSGTQRASVMYVHSQPEQAQHFFPAVAAHLGSQVAVQ